MKRKIVIIGDDVDFVARMSQRLSDEGYAVMHCCDGNEGVVKVLDESPGMIVLDMTAASESQAACIARFLGDDASLRDIPVIVVSDADRERYGRGAPDKFTVRDVVSKSVDPDTFIKKIALHMAQSGGEQHTMLVEDLQTIVDKWKDCKGNLIMILHAVQSKYGYVPRNVAFELSKMIDVPLAQIYEVITFYNFFKLEKPGTYKLSLCMGTACYLKGAQDLLEELKRLLHVPEGGTTSDGMFTLETVRCIGCCGLAPVLMINDKVYGKLKKENLPGILSQYVNKEPAQQAV